MTFGDSQVESFWYVSDGSTTYPVETVEALVQQIASGYWGEGCHAWRAPWSQWRPIESLREVQALRRAQRSRGTAWRPEHDWSLEASQSFRLSKIVAAIASASDESECIAIALQGMIQETSANVGLAHRPRNVLGPLETRTAVGDEVVGQLGGVIESSDAAVRSARLGAFILNLPHTSLAGDVSAKRLGGRRVQSVALVPIHCGAGLAAVIELGKYDHAFRRSDRATLSSIARKTTAVLSRMRSAS